MSDTIRILIVDDHAVVRKGLAMVLRLEPGFEIAGEAENGLLGLQAAEALQPDILLADLIMPHMDGQQMALEVRKKHPRVKIIMLTGSEVDDRVFDLIAAGIEGYIFKNIEPAELVNAIHAVYRGEAVLHPAVMRKVVSRMSVPPAAVTGLTPREMEVLEQMCTPATYKQIAVSLRISEETVRTHAKNILEKLKQPNRAQAALYAIKNGLVKLRE